MISVAAKLLRWYRTHGRTLPWRGIRDPYRILVSEVMLQQTQVERVKDKYAAWLKLFPTWAHLARASRESVIRAWSGLGYNRRALVLQSIAQCVVETGVPHTQEAWLTLKGVGPYTSAAVACFADHERVLPIDTNVRRVLGRVFLHIPFAQKEDDAALSAYANEILPAKTAYWDVPQALFDLATDVCKKQPLCADCPLQTVCPMARAFIRGDVAIPARSVKKHNERKHADKSFPDRIYRGRILALVTKHGKTQMNTLGIQIDPAFNPTQDTDWLHRMIQRLVKDGLLIQQGKTLTLPR